MAYTLAKHKEIEAKTNDGIITLSEFKDAFNEALQSEESLKQELSTLKKDELLKILGGYNATRYKSETKDRVISAVIDDIITFFALGSYSHSFGGNKHQGVINKVNTITEKSLAEHAEKVAEYRADYKKRLEEYKKALSNPETIEEFKVFIRVKGKESLTPEQLIKYEELIGLSTKERQARDIEQKAVISKVNISSDVELKIHETKHTKTGQPLYVVKLSDRVDRDTYNDLNTKAKKLGGWYSSYTKDGAIAGFQFKEKEQAEKFVQLKEGNVSNIEKIEEKKEEKSEKRVAKIREVAENIIEKVNEELNKPRLTNTARRASMASSAEARLNAEKAIAKTMLNIADAIESGQTKFLDQIRTKAQIEQLDGIISNANSNYIRSKYSRYSEYESHRYDKATIECIDFVSPYYMFFPSIYVEHFKRAIDKYSSRSGLKQISAKISKYLAKAKGDNYQIAHKYEMEDFIEFGEKLPDEWDVSRVKDLIKDHKRLKTLGIESNEMFRALLREYIEYRGGVEQLDKVKELERKLAGRKVGIDFFPTPQSVCEYMVELSEISKDMHVLEPNGGNGNICDAIKNATGIYSDTCEISDDLRAILEAKGYNVVAFDFVEYNEKKYDRILMNPPFSDRMDALHIQHAYSLLKSNGKLVAIAGEGVFNGSDKKAVAFREWLDAVNADVQRLPEKTFTDKNLYATTGANARLIVISKNEADKDELKEVELVEDIETTKEEENNIVAIPPILEISEINILSSEINDESLLSLCSNADKDGSTIIAKVKPSEVEKYKGFGFELK